MSVTVSEDCRHGAVKLTVVWHLSLNCKFCRVHLINRNVQWASSKTTPPGIQRESDSTKDIIQWSQPAVFTGHTAILSVHQEQLDDVDLMADAQDWEFVKRYRSRERIFWKFLL